MKRQPKAWCVLPIVALGFGLRTLMTAVSESCKREVGTSAICVIDWMKTPDDYASSS